MTSAPKWHRVLAAIGPAPNQEKSATRNPSRGRFDTVGSSLQLGQDGFGVFAEARRAGDGGRRLGEPVRRPGKLDRPARGRFWQRDVPVARAQLRVFGEVLRRRHDPYEQLPLLALLIG